MDDLAVTQPSEFLLFMQLLAPSRLFQLSSHSGSNGLISRHHLPIFALIFEHQSYHHHERQKKKHCLHLIDYQQAEF